MMVLGYDKIFDLYKLRSYFDSIRSKGAWGQVSVTYRPNQMPYSDGCGKAYDIETETRYFSERHFTEIVDGEANPIFDVIQIVKKIAKLEFDLAIGRVRFMTLDPKTCLSYHIDEDSYRYHIPLYTNSHSFFIVDKKVYEMPEEGRLYRLRTDLPHTALNAHISSPRTHLVFSTVPKSTQHLP